MSPRREAQVRAAQVGLKSQDQFERADRELRDELRKIKAPSESLRRRIWNGARGGITSPTPEVSNVAKAGRDWLISKGWEPDWSLILDGRGRVVGRLEIEAEVTP